MGSIKHYLENMQKLANATPAQDVEKTAFEATLDKLAALKLAQDLAAAAEEEIVPDGEEEIVEEEATEASPDEIAEALSEIVNQVETLDDEDQNTILESADALEDEEEAAGEKVSSVMDYVALLNYLGL